MTKDNKQDFGNMEFPHGMEQRLISSIDRWDKQERDGIKRRKIIRYCSLVASAAAVVCLIFVLIPSEQEQSYQQRPVAITQTKMQRPQKHISSTQETAIAKQDEQNALPREIKLNSKPAKTPKANESIAQEQAAPTNADYNTTASQNIDSIAEFEKAYAKAVDALELLAVNVNKSIELISLIKN